MTNWDNIYKKYNKGGEKWQKLSEGIVPHCLTETINPFFVELVNNTNFKKKVALDIGCGTGSYLFFLAGLGFKVDGVDSSQTSIEMTKKLLGKKAVKIEKRDMFNMEIEKNKYELILSVSTMNHGYKEDFRKLVVQIQDALVENGKFFINIPDIKCIGNWRTFKKYKIVDKNTVLPLIGPEKDVPHSFYTKDEVREIFDIFSDLKIIEGKYGHWIVFATK